MIEIDAGEFEDDDDDRDVDEEAERERHSGLATDESATSLPGPDYVVRVYSQLSDESLEFHDVISDGRFWCRTAGGALSGPFATLADAVRNTPALRELSCGVTHILAPGLDDTAIVDLFSGQCGSRIRFSKHDGPDCFDWEGPIDYDDLVEAREWFWLEAYDEVGWRPEAVSDHPDTVEVAHLHWVVRGRDDGGPAQMAVGFGADGVASLYRLGDRYYWDDGDGNVVKDLLGRFETDEDAKEALWDRMGGGNGPLLSWDGW